TNILLYSIASVDPLVLGVRVWPQAIPRCLRWAVPGSIFFVNSVSEITHVAIKNVNIEKPSMTDKRAKNFFIPSLYDAKSNAFLKFITT
ncbi:hypothetical protein ACJX0J_015986, partial [Zea mays]